MMKRIVLPLCSFLLLAQSSFAADLLTLVPGDQNCDGVTIPKSATLNIAPAPVTLTTIGAGLRQKREVFWIKVYCLSVMVSEPANFVRSADNDAALNSTDAMNAYALRLDFVRGVDAATVSQSFADALRANGADIVSDKNVVAFLDAVKNGGEATSGGALTIAADPKLGVVIYEDTNGKQTTIPADAKLTHQIMSIWLGNPADSGLANLKPLLIGG